MVVLSAKYVATVWLQSLTHLRVESSAQGVAPAGLQVYTHVRVESTSAYRPAVTHDGTHSLTPGSLKLGDMQYCWHILVEVSPYEFNGQYATHALVVFYPKVPNGQLDAATHARE